MLASRYDLVQFSVTISKTLQNVCFSYLLDSKISDWKTFSIFWLEVAKLGRVTEARLVQLHAPGPASRKAGHRLPAGTGTHTVQCMYVHTWPAAQSSTSRSTHCLILNMHTYMGLHSHWIQPPSAVQLLTPGPKLSTSPLAALACAQPRLQHTHTLHSLQISLSGPSPWPHRRTTFGPAKHVHREPWPRKIVRNLV